MAHEQVSVLRVRYAETDQMGVVYHANYLAWCEIGRTELMRDGGVPYALLEDDGVLLAVSDVALRYHAAARYDDVIRVRTTVTRVGSRGVAFRYLIEHGERGTLLVSASTSLVAINRLGRPVVLPPSVRIALDALVTPDAGQR